MADIRSGVSGRNVLVGRKAVAEVTRG